MAGMFETLQQRFPEVALNSEAFRDNLRVIVPADQVHGILSYLHREHHFDMLCDIAGIDYLGYPDASDRFAVVYALTNTATGERVFIKTLVNDPDPELPSVTNLWAGANWMEREVYDMFGIVFVDHPDLRRILLPEEFTSFPLRKDYPLRGYGERHNLPVINRADS